MATPRCSPLPDAGGVSHRIGVAEQIAESLPEHEHYVEVFGASLDVLFAKHPSGVELVNDITQDLVTFWKVLRERPGDLSRWCALTPHSRAEHSAAITGDTAGVCRLSVEDRELERARRVWVQVCQSKPGRATLVARPEWRQWAYPTARVHGSAGVEEYTARMAAAAARLQRVILECRRPETLIKEVTRRGKRVCVYADMRPQCASGGYWVGSARSPESVVLEHLLECKAAVVVRGQLGQFDDVLAGWTTMQLDGKSPETLWANRPLGAQPALFDIDAGCRP